MARLQQKHSARYRVSVAVRVSFAISLLAASANLAQARSLAQIEQSKELRICIAPVHPAIATVEPPACRDKCEFSGPAYEQTLVFAKFLGKGIRPKFLRVEWDEQFFNKEGKTVREGSYTPELLAAAKCDLYPSNLTKNEWRMKKLDFVTVFPSRLMVIVSSAMKGKLKAPPDLAGKTAAVEKDTSFHTWLQVQNQTTYANNPVKLELLGTTESLLAVEAGKVDFTIADSDIAIWAVRHELKSATTAFPVGATDELGWGFRKDDKDLQAAAQKFIDDQRKNPGSEVNYIWKKHFGRTLTEFIALMVAVK
ncbi:MAG: transporter substrate-binding domain-containing protein [Rhodocyclaceae bacterium]|nr:transporter substrate-binding domain-containing protein [Rhodocyclaceae bacterium]